MEQNPSMVTLERLIKSNEKDQRFFLRYFSRLPLEYRVKLMQRHKKILYKIKDHTPGVEIEILSYAAMIMAVKTFYSEEKMLSQKRFDDMSLEDIADLSLMKIKQFENRQPSHTPKRDQLIGYWGEVKPLKKMGKGFRYIAKYLLVKHRFKVGHTLIQMTWKQLEEEKL